MKNLTFEDLTQIIELQQAVGTSNATLNELMHIICDQTKSLTHAAGSVVEMAEDDEMVYTACAGTLAKSLGLRLKQATSLSGLSVAKAEVLHCEDSETDSRVDREASRKVGARSMICVPLLYQNKAIGVLKVVDPDAYKFSQRDVTVLRLIGNLLSATIAQAKSHQQVIDSEVRFRTLVEGASDGIIISKDGICQEGNTSFTKMFGYTSDDIHNMNVFDLIVPDQREAAREKVRTGFGKSYEATGLRKDGSTFDIEVQGKSLIINGEEIRMTTIRDISEKKLVEQALKESEKKSREATKAKSEFLANMSHEIRTPLNGILGMTGLLMDTELTSLQRNYTEIIRNSGDSLLSIVNDILDFSKIEAKKLILERISFELRPAIEDIKNILSFSISQKGLELNIEIDKNVPKFVFGDPTRIRQILMNLVGNAVKFTHGGSVTIKVSAKESNVRFNVIDTGIGIPSDALTGMFQAFAQVDSSTTRKYGGTGLGLSICRELVLAMKGEIGVSSEENKGSTFWFEIPLEEDTQHKKSASNSNQISTPANRLRVLVAEDNAVNGLIARKMLEKLGHTVTLVGNGKEALEALKLAHYDVVLMDCQMPELDGFETTEQIRASHETWKSIPIIAMTAHAMTGDREKCLSAGMDDYVSKPMKIEDISKVLAKY